ncbi:MAG: hypothetical protein RIR70_2097 [Pseudomonadota bacterium]
MRLIFAVLSVLICSVSFAQSAAKDVPWQVIAQEKYANFVTNWDAAKNPVRCALIQTPAQYDAYFAPAATMGYKGRYAPEAALYDTDSILLVARVVTAPLGKTVFKTERVIEKDGTLELHYRFFDPHSNESFKLKQSLSVRIPKGKYTRVRFIENGEKVCEQDIAAIVAPAPPNTR